MPIKINHELISDEEVFKEMQYYPAEEVKEAQYLAALGLSLKSLLLQRAKEMGFEAPNDALKEEREHYLIEKVIEEEVEAPEPTDEELRRYYESNKKKFLNKNGDIHAFGKVKDCIHTFLVDHAFHSGLKQYLKILAGKSKIEGIVMEKQNSSLSNG